MWKSTSTQVLRHMIATPEMVYCRISLKRFTGIWLSLSWDTYYLEGSHPMRGSLILGSPSDSHSCPCYLKVQWLQCALHGADLEDPQELQVVQYAVTWAAMSLLPYSHMTPLLHKVNWLPLCFQVSFKGLVVTYEALHGMGAAYLRNCLSPMVSAWWIRVNRISVIWNLLIEHCIFWNLGSVASPLLTCSLEGDSLRYPDSCHSDGFPKSLKDLAVLPGLGVGE